MLYSCFERTIRWVQWERLQHWLMKWATTLAWYMTRMVSRRVLVQWKNTVRNSRGNKAFDTGGHQSVLFIIQLLYSVRIPIFWLADLYLVTLGYDKTTSLTSLSWCNSRGVNTTQHGHYTMASAHSKFDDLSVFLCAVYSIWIIEISTHSLLVNYRDLPALVDWQWTRNFKYRTRLYWNFSFIVSELVQVNISW